MSPSNKVRGMTAYQREYPARGDNIRIFTLNAEGMLDFDENSAFVFFESSLDHTAHQYDYTCEFDEN